MNNYPAWWNATITVFNKFVNTSTNETTWYKHEISGAFWRVTGQKVVIGETVIDTSVTTCRIRKDDCFMAKYLWNDLTSQEKSAKFTLAPGDIIVLGTTTDTIDEYTSGCRSSDLISRHRILQGVMTIQKVNNNTGEGLGQEHYFVRGV